MKPKKLNLEEMWKVYLFLRHALEDDEEVNVYSVILNSEPRFLLEALRVLYDNKVTMDNEYNFIKLFSEGLESNDFSEFVNIVRGL